MGINTFRHSIYTPRSVQNWDQLISIPHWHGIDTKWLVTDSRLGLPPLAFKHLGHPPVLHFSVLGTWGHSATWPRVLGHPRGLSSASKPALFSRFTWNTYKTTLRAISHKKATYIYKHNILEDLSTKNLHYLVLITHPNLNFAST